MSVHSAEIGQYMTRVRRLRCKLYDQRMAVLTAGGRQLRQLVHVEGLLPPGQEDAPDDGLHHLEYDGTCNTWTDDVTNDTIYASSSQVLYIGVLLKTISTTRQCVATGCLTLAFS